VTFLVHGEDKARQAIAEDLQGGRIELPGLHQSYEL
jgi:hypothetical protein